jgi:MYXO-CTERM domain-containing protein
MEDMMRKTIAATVLAGSFALAPVVDSVHAQDDAAATEEDDDGDIGLWGLAGLAGLLGLLGLRRREPRRDTTYAGETTARRVP